MPKANRSRSIESLETRCLLAGDLAGLQISELLPVNLASIETRVRDEPDDRFRGDTFTPDWIELHNTSDRELDLAGAQLTDDPKHIDVWQVPAGVTLAPGQRVVVLASGLDVRDTQLDESEHLHADFKLDASGDYVALLDRDGSELDVIIDYPKLDADLSWGRSPEGTFGILTTPTPAAANSEAFLGEVSDTEFSVQRGFYADPFDVAISTTTPDAQIRYTTDGSEPSRSNGMVYQTPLRITTTTNLRAAAFKDGYVPTDVDTQTYVFVADVIEQPAEIEGFPNGGRVWAGQNVYVPQDTAMDPDIVNDPAYSDVVDDALLAIPTMSITSDPGLVFGNDTGWYYGEDIEGAVSVELLYPQDAASNQQINAGIESHSHDRLKRSLRLNFREVYGDSVFETDYFQRSPVAGDSATDEFNAIILRGGNNRSWSRIWNPDKTAFAIDEFFRSTQIAMSGYGMRGQVAHLYINGVYWGLYNPVERADQEFGSQYFGGSSDDWFTLNHGGDLAGNDDRWDDLRRFARQDMTDPANYEQLREMLDVDAFIDYLVASWWTAVSDWPQNNYYGTNRNESPSLDAEPFRFLAWDGEWSWGQGNQSSSDGRAHVHPSFRANARGGDPISSLWHAARVNVDFMNRFQDRVYQHLHGDGALTEENALQRWDSLTGMVREAVVAESARWGDSLETVGQPTRTRNVDWQREVDRISGLIRGNNESFLSALRTEGFYPDAEPPRFSIGGETTWGGKVAPATELEVEANAVGEIYIGRDGADPRLPDGSVAADAILLTPEAVLTIDRPTSFIARSKDGDVWSAFNRVSFTTGQATGLTITEIDFNPGEPTADEVALGLADNDLFEFVELSNQADTPLDLTGFRFDDGIRHTFDGAVLAAGETVVLARNPKAFRARYGDGIRVIGQFSASRLANGGEQLVLLDSSGERVFAVDFEDGNPWPGADGDGNSLQTSASATQVAEAGSWIAAAPTPGEIAAVVLDLNGDGSVDATDVDHLCTRLAQNDLRFDFNGDGTTDIDDVDWYVVGQLGSVFGDANFDGVFNSSDFVLAFETNEYEDDVVGNSGWAEGDWNCDGEFDTRDLVFAFQRGGYTSAAAASPSWLRLVAAADLKQRR